MEWKKINRDDRVQPKNGTYSDWKEQISKDCYQQCVYCSISEGQWGGIDHYNIDHFRPKKKFEDLINTITNLYYSCPVCNRFKSDCWPSEPDTLEKVCFPDPSDHDYNALFEIDKKEYTLKGNFVSSDYIINQLYLNRPQLIYERREEYLIAIENELRNEVLNLCNELNDNDLLRNAFSIINNLINHLHRRKDIRPYKLAEIRKP